MKTNNKAWARRVTSAVSACAILVMFNQCVQEYEEVQEVEFSPVTMPNDNIHNDIGAGEVPVEPPQSGGAIIEEAPIVPEEEKEKGATIAARTAASVGVLNFEQIDATFSAITGMSRFNNTDIRNAYNENFLGLPETNDIKSFNAANTMAVFKLASQYCASMVQNNTARNNFFNGIINLDQAPSSVLSNSTQKLAFVNGMISKIWGDNVADTDMLNGYDAMKLDADGNEVMMPIPGARNELMSLVDDLLDGENQGSSNTSRSVAIGVCAAMLSSPQVIYL